MNFLESQNWFSMSDRELNHFKLGKFGGCPEDWDDFKFNFLNLCEMQDDFVEYFISAVAEPPAAERKQNGYRRRADRMLSWLSIWTRLLWFIFGMWKEMDVLHGSR